MYKIQNKYIRFPYINQSIQGESLERQLERAMHNKQPLTDASKAAPLIYTERKDGVKPSTNIRTDRFEIAIDATEKIAKSYKARREEKPEMKVVKDDGEAKSIQGKPETGTKLAN